MDTLLSGVTACNDKSHGCGVRDTKGGSVRVTVVSAYMSECAVVEGESFYCGPLSTRLADEEDPTCGLEVVTDVGRAGLCERASDIEFIDG